MQYVVRTLSHAEIIALYSVADVALVTSIREGINLSAMEFVACQSNVHEQLSQMQSKPSNLEILGKKSGGSIPVSAQKSQNDDSIMDWNREKGVLVYSEFAGCASSFKVNNRNLHDSSFHTYSTVLIFTMIPTMVPLVLYD